MRRLTLFVCTAAAAMTAAAQLIDQTTAPNPAGEGIAKSWIQQIGSGRGSVNEPGSSLFIIARDPFRSIRRGRQVFNRKFTLAQGQGSPLRNGTGDITADPKIGAGLADSCAACHGRPRGSAGFGGDVVTRPDSRDAPHLFGLGLQEMLADEITAELRAARTAAMEEARRTGRPVTRVLESKRISYGRITAQPDGRLDTSGVQGVDADLRVRPFFAQGGTISIREFIVGAFNAEMGMQGADPDLAAAVAGRRVVTPAGMVLDGSLDTIETPPAANASDDPDGDGVRNELPVSIVDHMEFYLLNYFKPAVHRQARQGRSGEALFSAIGCAGCHIQDLRIERDRRVADVETAYDPANGIFNNLFATATPLFVAQNDGSGFPAVKRPALRPFLVRNIYTDFKRHDLGPAFWERNYDGSLQKEFITEPLWGVGSTAPYGHDGRSISLEEVILRHGGEAEQSRRRYAALPERQQEEILAFLNTLVLFPPDDTASNLNPGDRSAPAFPQNGHGNIRLPALFNDPSDPE